jgi:surface antigen
MFSKSDADSDVTGTVTSRAQHVAVAAQVSEADLAYARMAAAEALARGGKANSVPWQNPQTGVGGNITPLASSHSEDGLPCRDFLASYVSGASQAWLQGSACRTARGDWQVKTLKPLT